MYYFDKAGYELMEQDDSLIGVGLMTINHFTIPLHICYDSTDFPTKEVSHLSKEAYMSVSWGKRITKLDKSTILYAIANRKYVEVHVNKDYVFKTSASFMVVKEQLAEGFIEVKRGLVVFERAIDYIADTIRLVNGEELDYTIQR